MRKSGPEFISHLQLVLRKGLKREPGTLSHAAFGSDIQAGAVPATVTGEFLPHNATGPIIRAGKAEQETMIREPGDLPAAVDPLCGRVHPHDRSNASA